MWSPSCRCELWVVFGFRGFGWWWHRFLLDTEKMMIFFKWHHCEFMYWCTVFKYVYVDIICIYIYFQYIVSIWWAQVLLKYHSVWKRLIGQSRHALVSDHEHLRLMTWYCIILLHRSIMYKTYSGNFPLLKKRQILSLQTVSGPQHVVCFPLLTLRRYLLHAFEALQKPGSEEISAVMSSTSRVFRDFFLVERTEIP